jgi:NAD+ kinase
VKKSHAVNVLVVVKQTSYERFVLRGRVDADAARPAASRIANRHDPVAAAAKQTHAEHTHALNVVLLALTKLGVAIRITQRRHWRLGTRLPSLVVTVGGDGTFLMASHTLPAGVPILGVNSAPLTSVGFFCATSADTAESVLTTALAGRLSRVQLARMRVIHDGVVVSSRVLNEALVCHASPAATSRYEISSGKAVIEDQRSSGIWIGPPAGSTAAQRSAGGRVLPLSTSQLQYVVREPYTPLGKPLGHVRGLVPAGESLELLLKMRRAMLFLDGQPAPVAIGLGSKLAFSVSPEPLTVLGLTRRPTKAKPTK